MERLTNSSEISEAHGDKLEESESDFDSWDEEIPANSGPKRLKTSNDASIDARPDGAPAVKKPIILGRGKPFFELKSEGKVASVDRDEIKRTPLFLSDIQELLMFAVRGGNAVPKPGPWCSLTGHPYISHTALVVIEGFARDDFVDYRDCFPSLDAIFSNKVEVITPSAFAGSLIEPLIVIPVSASEQRLVLQGFSSLAGALRRHPNFYHLVPAAPLDKDPPPDETIGPKPALKAAQAKAEKQESIKKSNLMYERFIEVLKARRGHLRALAQKKAQEKLKKKQVGKNGKPEPEKAPQKPSTFKEREKKQNAKLELQGKKYAIKLIARRREEKIFQALPPTDKFPRTDLIMSPQQLVEEGIPIPLEGAFKDRYSDYVMTKDLYKPAEWDSPMFALDCEMVMTTAANGTLELARVSIVNEQNECIYDELVLPFNKITHYLTCYSGITADMLTGVTKRLNDVRQDIRALLPMDAILIGHSIGNDLHTLRMMHPYLIDTSVVFNINPQRRQKAKLAVLAKEFLDMTIQQGVGHCSSEDSIACMKLVQLKLSKQISFGDNTVEVPKTRWAGFKESNWKTFLLTGKKSEDCMIIELNKYHPIHAEKFSKESRPLELQTTLEESVQKSHWMESVRLGAPLFRLLKFQNKPAALVSTSDIISEYIGWLPTTMRKIADHVSVISARDNRELLERTAKAVRLNWYTISHARFDPSLMEKATKEVKRTIFKEIDKSFQKIWDSMAEDGLCVVIFGGRAAGTNGVCFIQANNDLKCTFDRTTTVPKSTAV